MASKTLFLVMAGMVSGHGAKQTEAIPKPITFGLHAGFGVASESRCSTMRHTQPTAFRVQLPG